MTDKTKKDAFLIARVTTQEKNYLLEEAKKKKIGLSKLVRQMIANLIASKEAKQS